MNQVSELNARVETLRARLEVIKKEETRSWTELMMDFATTGARSTLLKVLLTCPFTKDLPSDVQSMLLQGFEANAGEKSLKALPLSRKKRRALISSRRWVVNLASEEATSSDSPFNVMALAGKVVLDVNLARSRLWDLNREDGVYQLLLWAAATGRVSDIIAVPPCSTWPNSLAPTRGPESYPTRSATSPYGIKELTAWQRQQVDAETALLAKPMLLWVLAQMRGNQDVGFLLDLPSDCERLRRDDPHRASVWSTELWNSFRSIAGMGTTSFYMGAYGHRAKRPTTMATTYPALLQMDNNYDFHDGCVPPSLLSYQEMRKWPSLFKGLVAEAIGDYHSARWSDEEELVKAGIKLSKLTKEQREAWQRHLLNDHQPYRSDCSVCINAQATGYQHRRRKHPAMYTVAFDLAGPFKQKGRDMEHDDYKYIMVAAYRCPKEYMSAKALSELERELYVPDEPEDQESS